ncbi:MAG: hemin uptake protein HemP [Pseudomonadota bacterium]
MRETNRQSKGPEPRAVRTLQAPDLFAGQREIVIQYQGVSYRLRITRNEKLILCK